MRERECVCVTGRNSVRVREKCTGVPSGGAVLIHPEDAGMSGRHGAQDVAQCVACAALTLVVWQ